MLVFSPLEALPLLNEEKWQRIRRAEVRQMILGGSKKKRKFVQDQEFFRRRMLAPRHVVVAASGKQHEVKQEEEFNDDGFVVGLSFIDHEGPRHCAISGMFVGYARSICCGTNAPESARLQRGECRDL